MYPCQDPIINHRILEHHPFSVDFGGSRAQKEPASSSISQAKASTLDVVSMLPSEVWAEVFLSCLPEPPPIDGPYPWYNRDKYINPLTAPLLLCQVCRVWRHIAVAVPQLWQRLGVYVSMGTACPAPGLAKLWLARSGSLPLTLSLHQQNEANLNALATSQILVLFFQHSARWMDINLSLAGSRLVFGNQPGPAINPSASDYSSATDETIVSPSPTLRTFRFRTSSRVYEREERYIFGVFQGVPRLNTLHISRVPELDLLGNSTVGVPWRQLSTLTLDFVPSIGTALHLLIRCDRLEECKFKADTLFGPLPQEAFVHTSLKRLSMSAGIGHFTAFIERISLPALEGLTVDVQGSLENYTWPHAPFEAFLNRSLCTLTHLTLHDSGMRLYQFVRAIQHPFLQEIQELVVDDRRGWTWEPFVKDLAVDLLNCALCPETHTVLALLDGAYILTGGSVALELDNEPEDGGGSGIARKRQRTCFLPRLEGLTIRGNSLDTTDGTIADMVESRFYFREEGVKRLKHIKLDIPSNHLGDIQRLKAIQTEGLELELEFI